MHELNAYDYELPEELIAAHPLESRTDSRMLVVERETGRISHHAVSELPRFLQPHDSLVLNDTKVLPARLFGRRVQTGGKWEGLYLGSGPDNSWKMICQTRGRLLEGEQIRIVPASQWQTGAVDDQREVLRPQLRLTLISRDGEGVWLARPEPVGDPIEQLRKFGTMPLPPYIKRPVAEEEDWHRYQTAYARRPGAVAAPTAGLHLTEELLNECRRADAKTVFVTLHVGVGTFRPITAEKLSEHAMHTEWCELSPFSAAELNQTRRQGGRVFAVGTTSVRTLETASQTGGVEPFAGETDLFIRPGHTFRAVDGLLTNFHLPKSTLLVLVSTFGGLELMRAAYQEAIRQRYRFYSYGDAMLIL